MARSYLGFDLYSQNAILSKMYRYSQINGQIPAPVCTIQLQNPSITLQPIDCKVKVIVDSGAAITCIPQAKIDLLGNLIESYKAMRTADNRISNRTTYYIDIKLGNRDYKNIEVFAIPKEHGVLGRDIINKHKVSLNAPSENWGTDCCEITCIYQNQKNS